MALVKDKTTTEQLPPTPVHQLLQTTPAPSTSEGEEEEGGEGEEGEGEGEEGGGEGGREKEGKRIY